jgi:hypothetical protein
MGDTEKIAVFVGKLAHKGFERTGDSRGNLPDNSLESVDL